MRINRSTEYNSLVFYRQFREEISTKSGIYYWYFWPFKEEQLKDPNFDIFLNTIRYFSSVNLNLPEVGNTGYKFSVEIRERGIDGGLLGLGDSKTTILLEYLEKSQENRKIFLDFLQNITFAKPFYIGKANNLRNRLSQHFEHKNSNILIYLDELEIPHENILIGYEELESLQDSNINVTFEEIAQRIMKPGLTKRPG